MNQDVQVVDRDDNGRNWAIRSVEGGTVLQSCRTKVEAIDSATASVRSRGGGIVRVYLGDGRLERTISISAPITAPWPQLSSTPATDEEPDVVGVGRQLKSEGEHVDSGLEVVLLVLSLLGTSAIAGWTSPEVTGAMGEGWIAVGFATLSWSLACCFAYLVVTKSGLAGWPMFTAVGVGIVVSCGIANLIGTGVLDLEAYRPRGGGPLGPLLGFVALAVETYGPFGALVGAAVGVWVASRVAKLIPDGFLS